VKSKNQENGKGNTGWAKEICMSSR